MGSPAGPCGDQRAWRRPDHLNLNVFSFCLSCCFRSFQAVCSSRQVRSVWDPSALGVGLGLAGAGGDGCHIPFAAAFWLGCCSVGEMPALGWLPQEFPAECRNGLFLAKNPQTPLFELSLSWNGVSAHDVLGRCSDI